MRSIFYSFTIFFLLLGTAHGQEQLLATPYYKHVKIQTPGIGDFTQAVILLHELYTGTGLKANNFVIGDLHTSRGSMVSLNRINRVSISSRTAYNTNHASIESQSSDQHWVLVTCDYEGKSYMALQVPYQAPLLDGGFFFTGWTSSTGENLKYVVYKRKGVPENQDKLTNIQGFSPTMQQYTQFGSHIFSGSVGIGTFAPNEKLAVNGNIRAKEIKVEAANWPDYVFKKDYQLMPLKDVEQHILKHGHLPDIPKAEQIEKEGLSVSEMNKLMMKKIEELTLHLIEKDKRIGELELLNKRFAELEKRVHTVETKGIKLF